MPHVFFQSLEKRRNTQSLSPFNNFGFDLVAYPEYGIGLPNDPWLNWSSPVSTWGWSTPISNWGWSSPWSDWSSPWSNWSSPWSNWSSPWSNWNEPVLIYAAPAPSPWTPDWSSSYPWTGTDTPYPPGTLYGLIKRSNLKT